MILAIRSAFLYKLVTRHLLFCTTDTREALNAMIRLTTSKARQDFSAVVEAVGKGERVLLSRHGKAVAVVVSVEDLALLKAIEDRGDARAARAALDDAEKNGTVPWEQVKADLGF